MPKVLRIINRFNLGGPTFNAALLTKYMSPKYETMLIGGKEDKSEESSKFILENLGISGTLIEDMHRDLGLRQDRKAFLKIKQIIKEFKPDIIHTHASKAGALGRIASLANGNAKLVHTFHGHVFHSYFGSIKTSFYKNVERALALKTDKIIAISERQKLELSRKYNICNPDKIKVIPLGFELDKFQDDIATKRIFFREQFSLAEEDIAIGIIGRLAPIKNHRFFLEAFKKVKEQTSKNVRAFIIGDGSERESIKSYSNELGLDFLNGDFEKGKKASVHFTSWIKEIDIANAGLDIIALTSLNEGTPVSLIEAQASNKPIVTTRVGGVTNTVIPNETAFLTEKTDLDSFVLKMLKLVENDELRIQMGKNGWQHVKEKFHYSRLIRDMDETYQEILS